RCSPGPCYRTVPSGIAPPAPSQEREAARLLAGADLAARGVAAADAVDERRSQRVRARLQAARVPVDRERAARARAVDADPLAVGAEDDLLRAGGRARRDDQAVPLRREAVVCEREQPGDGRAADGLDLDRTERRVRVDR